MDPTAPNTLPKQERLCGKRGIERLLAEGKHGNEGTLRYIYLKDNGLEYPRLLISVPKKLFKRAVKRNLLKRRIRESWRRLKHEVKLKTGADILFIYSTKEILDYESIYSMVGRIIEKINARESRKDS